MKKTIDHPSEFISDEFIDPIRRAAPEAEHLRTLHPDQLSVIHKLGWFKMFVPKEYGGLELSLPDGIRIEECLSWADGSTGWVVTLCSGAAWFAGFLPAEVTKEVFAQDLVCFAGSGAPTGTASITPDGYEASGRWKYASGSLHATAFTANCVIKKGNDFLRNEDGTPLVRAFLFKREEVILHFSWKGMGMVATGSHEFEVNKLSLPLNRCFVIDAKHAVLKQPLYQFPFLQLAETTLAVNLSGMAVRFIDLCEPLFAERTKHKKYSAEQASLLKEKLTHAKNNLSKRRQVFYDTLEMSWNFCLTEKQIPTEILRDVSHASHSLVRASRQCVAELYQYCGLVAANSESEINRVWRNFHTASQHDIFTFS